MITYSKKELARRQLGTALQLFLDDADPVSVHCLACGGAELSDYLAREAGKASFAQHALSCNPKMEPKELISLRNQFWNAMKHATSWSGKLRDDKDLLSRFDDRQNDHYLFVGWYDYASAIGILPVEAQVFQVWYFANFPDKLAASMSKEAYEEVFPNIRKMDRLNSKSKLREKIQWARQQVDVLCDPRTDLRSLMLGS